MYYLKKFLVIIFLGNISPDATRIVSFFDGELVVGGLILCFGFLIATIF